MMKRKKRILEGAHEAAKDLHDAGVIDKKTMHEFDVLCIQPAEPLSQSAINGSPAPIFETDEERTSFH